MHRVDADDGDDKCVLLLLLSITHEQHEHPTNESKVKQTENYEAHTIDSNGRESISSPLCVLIEIRTTIIDDNEDGVQAECTPVAF